MNLQTRIDLLVQTGKYILSDDIMWQEAKEKSAIENSWFIPEFINHAVQNIATRFLQKDILEKFVVQYQLPAENKNPKTVGIVMAGNIPLVGFHDFLCAFLCGHRLHIKPSSKDEVLIKHIAEKLIARETALQNSIQFEGMLKGCDAYIATGSNNSSRYFDYYFGKYPNIIRRNRTSVAILKGNESPEQLESLADDVFLYFGLGCRSVTKIYAPKTYDFIPLINAFKKYNYLADNNKLKNNYDYNLALHIINNKFYMSTDSLLLVENESLFSPISQLHYGFYDDEKKLAESLQQREDLQCIVGSGYIPFGKAQVPAIDDFADGADTMRFLCSL
jgi:Acyl-CoA reductase (LuxC)